MRRGEFRNDLQGLRGLGALLVASFHIWFGGVSGGVDVFFVVTGYFLTRTLLAEEGLTPASVLTQYVRFFDRVVPQSLLALLAIFLLAVFLLSSANLRENVQGIAASAVYLQNWLLIFRGREYGAEADWLLVTQHFWAMSVIGQVYLLWPPLFYLADRAARLARRDRRGVLLGALILVSAESFLWSLALTATQPERAYFDLFARFWEFGAGALLAFFPSARPYLGQKAAALLSWLGLLLILTCGLAIGAGEAFPGYASLWPVSAAALLIVAGRSDDPRNAGRLLAWPVLGSLGGLAFGIYLWHWPLFVLASEAAQGARPGPVLGTAIIGVSVVLAALMTRLAAALARRSSSLPSAATFAAALAALAVTAASSDLLFKRHGDAESFWNPSGIAPGPFRARLDHADYHRMQTETGAAATTFIIGSTAPKARIALVGGSHSFQWLPALELIAERKEWEITVMTKASCLFADPSDPSLFAGEGQHPSCAAWNRSAMAALVSLRPDVVITLASRPTFGEGPRRSAPVMGERIPFGYIAAFETLVAEGIPVIAIRDTPWMGHDIPTCAFSRLSNRAAACGHSRKRVLNDEAFAAGLSALPLGIGVVDMTDALCDARHCGATRDGALVYHDPHHLTASYVRRLAPLLEERLDRAFISVGTVLSSAR